MFSFSVKKLCCLVLLGSCLAGFVTPAQAQLAGPPATDSILTAKNFPLLAMLQHDKAAARLLGRSKVLKRQAAAHRQRLLQAGRQCQTAACYVAALKYTEPEIATTARELVRLEKKRALGQLATRLRQQGSYARFDAEADTALLRQAWVEGARGLNRIFEVYVQSKPPRYPKIDSISFSRNDAAYLAQVQQMVRQLAGQDSKLFFALPLQACLRVLAFNKRDEAARYEPLQAGMNQAPAGKVKTTDFSAFPYSLILVPGLGPETPGMALDPNGAKRCAAGAERYKKGLAPFIVVSGGNVHPFQTPFNEAVEMKKYLVEQLGVPADVVFIEPHARHTTTNMRNTNRMIYRFGLPAHKPVLIVTDESQASYIVKRMEKTALRDLGYLPYQQLKEKSKVEIEYHPLRLSLHADPFDPLDP
ncbi:MAG: YdcF family protein [Adhaeribacter sp.]